VPEPERDVLEALNDLDTRMWRAQQDGADEVRMIILTRFLLKIAENIAARYSPELTPELLCRLPWAILADLAAKG
jgi:hypothetical protein